MTSADRRVSVVSTRSEIASGEAAIDCPRPSRLRANSSAPRRAAAASQFDCLPSTWAASDGVKPATCTSPRDTSRFKVAFCAFEVKSRSSGSGTAPIIS